MILGLVQQDSVYKLLCFTRAAHHSISGSEAEMNIYSNGFTASNLFDRQDGWSRSICGWLAAGITLPPKYVVWTLYAVGYANGATRASCKAW